MNSRFRPIRLRYATLKITNHNVALAFAGLRYGTDPDKHQQLLSHS